MSETVPCPGCNGTGELIIPSPCPDCSGKKRVSPEEAKTIKEWLFASAEGEVPTEELVPRI